MPQTEKSMFTVNGKQVELEYLADWKERVAAVAAASQDSTYANKWTLTLLKTMSYNIAVGQEAISHDYLVLAEAYVRGEH